jgi:small-conductance mechanosensitive channel/CRP-like cAMP-binding protein
MIDDELKLFHKLFLELGATATLAALLFGVYFFIAHKRAKRVPLSFFAVFMGTLVLYVILILDESELPFLQGIDLPKIVSQVLKFTAYLGTAFFFIKATDLLLVEDFLITKKGFNIPELLRMSFMVTGLAVAALIFLRTVLGINVIALIAIPTVMTAVIGFALQDTIKRFFAGITLGNLVRVGDWVLVAGREGLVTTIDLGHLTIMTRDDDLVMIPNNLVLQQDLLNYSRPSTTHGRSVMVEAAYNAAPMEVQRILADAAKAVPGVLSEPAPHAFTSAFKDSSIQYRVKYWIDDYAKAQDVEGQVLSYVWYAFQREGIEIPFPQRVIQILKPEEALTTAAKERDRILEGLGRVDFLSVLSPEERQNLANEATIRVYMPGEVVFHQGDEGSELFFILDGHVEVRVGENPHSVVATLNPLQFFGEMSLLTGEPRAATIVSQARLEVLVLNKESMARLLKSNPLLVEQISRVLVMRKSDLVAHQERTARRGGEEKEDPVQSLGDRIRNFFGLA